MGHEGVGVLIADDQKVVRDGLALILGMIDGVTVLGTAVDGADAVRQVQVLAPDVVLMDLHMPVLDGVQATEVLHREAPGSKVVVLTTYADDEWVFGALKAGALGFLTKDAGAEEIRTALLTVAAGQAQLDPGVQRRLLEALIRSDPANVAADGGAGSGGADGGAGSGGADGGAGTAGGGGRAVGGRVSATVPDGLTPREVDVLALIAQGLSNTEIAGRLFVSDSTVKTHINHLLAKTAMRDRAQLVAYAFRHQLTTP